MQVGKPLKGAGEATARPDKCKATGDSLQPGCVWPVAGVPWPARSTLQLMCLSSLSEFMSASSTSVLAMWAGTTPPLLEVPSGGNSFFLNPHHSF